VIRTDGAEKWEILLLGPSAKTGSLVRCARARNLEVVQLTGDDPPFEKWVLREPGPAEIRGGARSASPRGRLLCEVTWDCTWVGPGIIAGQPGCEECLRLRRDAARPDHDAEFEPGREGIPAVGKGVSLLPAITQIVLDLCAARLSVASPSSNRLTITRLDHRTLATTSHRLLPDPGCSSCDNRTLDRPEIAWIELNPRRASVEHPWRTRSLAPELPALVDRYVDREIGIAAQLGFDGRPPLPTAYAPVNCPDLFSSEVVGTGRDVTFSGSQLIALLEALERYAGLEPRGKQSVTRGSFQAFGHEAIDPRCFGLPDPARVERAFGTPLIPFTEDLELSWIWAHSMRRGRPVLVPESVAYYGLAGPDPGLFFESSNGCAIGGCLEEAILHGLLEVIERDSFLLAWYGRLQLARIDISGAGSTIALLVDRIEWTTGLKVHVFNATMDWQVPAFWLMAVNEGADDDKPQAVSTAGAHLDPELALEKGLGELASSAFNWSRRYPGCRAEALKSLEEPYKVLGIQDHAQLYTLPEAFPKLDFVYRSPKRARLRDILRAAPPRQSLDITGSLRQLVDRTLAIGLDVVIVDQTTPEQRLSGLSCVKVLVPGAVPITFGHGLRRTRGLNRLLSVPHTMGFVPSPLREDDLNLDPHPFP
jgi:ribosomal protein S12 methylthiotransferase accessory factor